MTWGEAWVRIRRVGSARFKWNTAEASEDASLRGEVQGAEASRGTPWKREGKDPSAPLRFAQDDRGRLERIRPSPLPTAALREIDGCHTQDPRGGRQGRGAAIAKTTNTSMRITSSFPLTISRSSLLSGTESTMTSPCIYSAGSHLNRLFLLFLTLSHIIDKPTRGTDGCLRRGLILRRKWGKLTKILIPSNQEYI